MVPTEDPRPESRSDWIWAIAWSSASDPRTLRSIDEIRAARRDDSVRLWIDLYEPTEDELKALGEILGLHSLVVEDIAESNQRAKVELTEESLHLVMFALRYEGEVLTDEVDIVLGKRFLLSSHGRSVRLREAPFVRRDPMAHLAAGPDYVLWAMADWLVDDYFPVFDRLGDEIDELEDEVLRRPSRALVERLFRVRRDLLVIRHSVLPQREIFNQLTNRDLPLIAPERVVYFRDVYDHLIRLTDELDSYRELVSTTMDIYLSQVNNNLSEIMKRLTAVTVVLAGVGAVAGIFGMSEAGLAFQLREAAGFWIVALAAVSVGALAAVYFRRIGWI